MTTTERAESDMRHAQNNRWCGICFVCRSVADTPAALCGCPAAKPCRTLPSPFAMTPGVAPRADRWPTAPCLESLGRRLAHSLYYRVDLALMPLPSNRQVLQLAVAMTASRQTEPVTLAQSLALVAGHLHHLSQHDGYRPRTVTKMVAQMASLVLFANALDKNHIADLTAGDITYWMGSRNGGRRLNGHAPSASTRRNRLTAARLFFRVLCQLGITTADPTRGMHGPAGGKRKTRPLTDGEIVLCRYSCTDLTGHHLYGAVMALAEATATTTELAGVLVRHVDLDLGTVQLVGIGQRRPRAGHLSRWGVEQMRRRIGWLAAHLEPGADLADVPLTYSGADVAGSNAAGAASGLLVAEILTAAGLHGEDNIKPGSIPTAFGLRLWRQTHDLGLVALALGCKTHDAAAHQIGVRVPSEATADMVTQIRAAVLGDDTNAARRRTSRPRPAAQARQGGGAR